MSFMYPYACSLEQIQVIDDARSLLNISYSNTRTALDTLVARLIRNLQKKEATILVLPSNVERNTLLTMLSELGLEPLLLSVFVHQTVSDSDFIGLHKKFHSHTPLASTDVDVLFKFEQSFNKIKHQLETKHGSTHKDSVWRGHLDKYLIISEAYKELPLFLELENLNLAFSDTELEKLKAMISDALFIYDKTFELLHEDQTSFEFTSQTQLLERLPDISFELFTFKEKASVLRDRFFSHYRYIENQIIQEQFLILTNLQDNLALLHHQIQCHIHQGENKSKSNAFVALFQNKTTKSKANNLTILARLNELCRSFASLKIASTITFKELNEATLHEITGLITILENHKNNLQKYAKEKIKSINHLNNANATLIDLETSLRTLFDQINQSKILHKKYELNTMSFLKQLEVSRQLTIDLELYLLKIEKQMVYYEWCAFENSLNADERIILGALRKIEPNEWLYAFEKWYVYQSLTKHPLVHHTVSEEAWQHCKALYDLAQTQLVALVCKEYDGEKKEAYNLLKSNHPALFQSIHKNKKYTHPITWKNLLTHYTSIWSQALPILIVDEDDLYDMPQGHYKHVYYFNPKNIHVDMLQSFTTVVTWYDQNQVTHAFDASLSLAPIQELAAIKNQSTNERLPAVRMMSEILLSFNMVPSIYQLRGACLISFASSYVNQYFQNALYRYGIKKIQSDDSMVQTMSGVLLDQDATIYILIEDGLIAPKNDAQYLRQHAVIAILEEANCNFLIVDTSKLLETPGTCLDELISHISNNTQSPTIKDKSQLSLELF